mmetsp:Transcript_13682/g.33205  ORF Transcript_13682/g.33205 Transcript_13682/m.33205 type:complete len:250 (-) Transcript_13682:126-875(-)
MLSDLELTRNLAFSAAALASCFECSEDKSHTNTPSISVSWASGLAPRRESTIEHSVIVTGRVYTSSQSGGSSSAAGRVAKRTVMVLPKYWIPSPTHDLRLTCLTIRSRSSESLFAASSFSAWLARTWLQNALNRAQSSGWRMGRMYFSVRPSGKIQLAMSLIASDAWMICDVASLRLSTPTPAFACITSRHLSPQIASSIRWMVASRSCSLVLPDSNPRTRLPSPPAHWPGTMTSMSAQREASTDLLSF